MMKRIVVSVALFGVVTLAKDLQDSKTKVVQDSKTSTKKESPEDMDIECESFDTYALCPGGWPMITADEAQHRTRCCGTAGEAGNCAMCSRCKIGSFADGCCDCDDDEVVDNFWQQMHKYHSGAKGETLSQHQLITIVGKAKGDMTQEEELKIKDVFSNIMTHVLTENQKTSAGLATTQAVLDYLRENPDIVSHMIGETESPSEGERQLAFDHSKAQTPEWSSGAEGQYAGHLPPEIIRRTQNGLWEVLVPNFTHPNNGYYPAQYRHSHQEAVAYAKEKKAEYLMQEAKQAEMTHNIRAKAAENVDLVHSDVGNGGYTKYGDQTAAEKHSNLVGLVEDNVSVSLVQKKGPGDDLNAAIAEVAQRTANLEAQANAPGAMTRITTTHTESTDVRVERAPVAEVVVQATDEVISMDAGSGSEGSGSAGSGDAAGSDAIAAFLEVAGGSEGSGSEGSGAAF